MLYLKKKQDKLWETICATMVEVRSFSTPELTNLIHLCDEKRLDIDFTVRTAAKIARAACEYELELRATAKGK